MQKFAISYGIGLVVAVIANIAAMPAGKDAIILWSLFFNALGLYIIILMTFEIKANRICGAPGFVERYKKVMNINLEMAEEVTTLKSELEYRKGALEQATQTAARMVQVPEQESSNGQFIPRNGMSRKEKQIRAYWMADIDKKPEDEIARELSLSKDSIRTYRSEGKRLIKGHEELLGGHPIEDVVDYFCGEKTA